MNNFNQNKLVQVVLYIINETKGLDYYHIFKIIYFSELSHLAKWGSRIIEDDYCAIPYGPVPTELYDAVKRFKNNKPNSSTLSKLLSENCKFAGDDAPNVLLPKVEADVDYLSESEKAEIDKSIRENVYLTFNALKEKSHDNAWRDARNGSNNIMSIEKMAEVAGATDDILEYIKDQIEIEKALS